MENKMTHPFPQEAPEHVKIYFTWLCNLHCPFCYEREARNALKSRPFEDFLKLIDELEALRVFLVSFCGGEPFAHPRFFELVERVVAARMRYSIMTNGTLITPEKADFIASTKRCRQVQISLDGTREFHDKLRGEGSFDAAVRAIKLLKERNLRVVVNTVISSGNYQNMLSLARFLETTGVDTYRMIPVRDHNAMLPEESAMLSQDEFAEVVAGLGTHLDELPHLNERSAPRSYFESILKPIQAKPERSNKRCITPFRALSVRPDGAVYSCEDMDCGILGYIGKDKISDLWKCAKLAEMREKVLCGVPPFRHAGCGNCKYSYYCSQYCPLWNYDFYCRKEIGEILQQKGIL